MIRSLSIGLLVVAASWTSAHAQDAEVLFQRGAAAFEAGQIAVAREAYAQSLAASPSVGTAFRLALALERAGFLTEAEAILLRLNSAEFGEVTNGQTPHIEALLTSARERIATLSVRTTPPDAEVRVDGRPIDATVRLDPGSHQITIIASGHDSAEQTVTLAAGQAEVVIVELHQLQATLIVDADDESHQVRVLGVGASMGRFQQQVPAGEYTIVVIGYGERREEKVLLEPGEVMRIRLGINSPRRAWPWVLGGIVLAGAAAAGLGTYFRRRNISDEIQNPDFGGVVMTLR